MAYANDIQCPTCPLSMRNRKVCFEIGWLSLDNTYCLKSENLIIKMEQMIVMMIYDCFSLLLDVEQMKLSTTAVKDTEEVQKWKEIRFL